MKKALLTTISIELLVLGALMYSSHTISFVRPGAVLTPSRAIITAYSSEESQTDSTPTIMASGKTVYKGAIACPRKYKFGQQVEIAGITYTCEDRKNIRYENYPDEYFDIWHEDTKSALEFGIQKQTVTVLYQ